MSTHRQRAPRMFPKWEGSSCWKRTFRFTYSLCPRMRLCVHPAACIRNRWLLYCQCGRMLSDEVKAQCQEQKFRTWSAATRIVWPSCKNWSHGFYVEERRMRRDFRWWKIRPNIWTETRGNMEKTVQNRKMYHLKVYPTTRKMRQISDWDQWARVSTQAAVEGVGRSPPPVEMQALPVRWSQYNLRSSKEAFGQSPKSGSTAQENNLQTRTAAQEGSGNGGQILS